MDDLSKTFLKNQNCLAKNLNKLCCFRGFHYKCHFMYAFDDNLSVTLVFIKQIFRPVKVAPPPFPLPHRAKQGVG
jgi:hypothetical protein